ETLAHLSEDIRTDKEQEATHRRRYDDQIEKIDEIDQRVMFDGRLEMASPRVRKIVIGVGMALLTGHQQVLLDDLRVLIGYGQDVVDTMTVVTDGLVRLFVRRLVVEKGDGRAVKISHVGVKDIGR